jgi:hypothetical protein
MPEPLLAAPTVTIPLSSPVLRAAEPVDREFEDRWSTWRARGVVEAQRTRQLAIAALVVVGVAVSALTAAVYWGGGS